MSPPEPKQMLVQLTVEELAALVEHAVSAALAKKAPVKLLYNTREAAAMLNVDPSWLSLKARAKKVPHRMLGHYRYFSMQDVDAIIESASVPVVQSEHDGQILQANTQATRHDSGESGETVGGDGDGSSTVGAKRKADHGAGGVVHEAFARKKAKGEMINGR